MLYLSILSVLAPLILGIILFNRLDQNSRIMVLLVSFATVSQLASYYLTKWNEIWIFYNSYAVIDAVVWGCLFFKNSKNKYIKTALLVILSAQTAFTSSTLINDGFDNRFFAEFVCLNSLLQILWVLFFFYEKFSMDEIQPLEKEPMFWYCLGILVYAPTTYFLFAFYDVVRHNNSNESYEHLWTIHHFLNTFMYLIFAVGIYVNVIRTRNQRYAIR